MTESPTLKGRRILVVGASAGIGQAFARSAAAAGADVVVSARRLDKLQELVAELGKGHAIACDVSDSQACDSLVHATVEVLGGLDLVLYTAGPEVRAAAAEDVAAAVRAGALPVGEEHGLPLVRFPLDRTADAHRALESGTVVGKILVDVPW